MYKYSTFEEEHNRSLIKGRVLSILEFDKIRAILEGYAITSAGAELCRQLCPSSNRNDVQNALDMTQAAITHISRFGNPPVSSVADISGYISYAKAGGTLTMGNLLDVASFLSQCEDLKNCAYNCRQSGNVEDEEIFLALMDEISGDKNLEASIKDAILGDNEMADNASSDLYAIRREKKDLARSIRVLLDRVISRNKEYLREDLITIREGRYCVPVIADFKGRIDGIIHGSSSSGQTIFVEPMSVVETNNKIKELSAQEESEIERILSVFSNRVASEEQQLLNDISLVATVDFATSKASMALDTESVVANIVGDGHVEFIGARHPLIAADAVVPVDISIGDGYDTLIITGPNTGGKTVSLKTCGLLTLMTMAGLGVPAKRAEVTVYDRVLADIGDEQSIEQSLSTFSAHIKSVVFILKNVRGKSLVLLDELGSGTDPSEGAALAISIIDALRAKGCITMATTHYRELKSYAVTTEGIMNASCEFDTDTLSPTYRLIVGRPGASNAFIISEKLGLPKKVIEDAKSNMSEQEISYSNLLSKAEEDAKRAQNAAEENERLKRELEEKTAALEEERQSLKQSKTKILEKARAEQRNLLEEKQEEITKLIDGIKAASDEESRKNAVKQMDTLRRKLRADISDMDSAENSEELSRRIALAGEKAVKVKAGEMYYVPSLGLTGKALSEPNKRGKLKIQAGAITVDVKADDLYVPTKQQKDKAVQKPKQKTNRVDSIRQIRFDATMRTSSEINLIGKTVDEAVSELETYIEDCALAGKHQVRIVHGKGTGALRSAVESFLANDIRVKSYRAGAQGEGDAGVTIAYL